MFNALVLCFFMLFVCSQGQETVNQESAFDNLDDAAVPVLVNDYLDRLSDGELRQICAERGFDIVHQDDNASSASRQDLLEGARRCLSLEDEMNAILAKHPELAAELDKEIERMRKQKELLEKEREEFLVHKSLLERQLKDSGVDIGGTLAAEPSISAVDTSATALTTPRPVPDTLQGVLKESFRELYERVMLDVQFLQRMLHPVTQHVNRLLQFVWRYARPVMGNVYTKCRYYLKEIQRRRKQQ
ncbi:hypothetical protein MPSEU_000521900 [Mayamaea pseudoterrestris]|nr:hypothetical protein MPSEU_000521900 [Mayamaea pseudoterrestris]